MTMISYAQNHEDVILNRVFHGETGFYIDVGAAHPVCHSVTKWFYSQGWTGINVEPLQSFFKLMEDDRPNDINLNCIVSDNSETVTLYEVPDSIGTSTVNQKLADQIAKSGTKLIPQTVRSITLANLCEKYVGQRTIDFLKIDAEGHERAVLAGGDFSKWRPRVIVIENTEHSTWESLVFEAGYQFALFDGLNRYYVRNEEPALLERLTASANCLDAYVPYEYAQKIAELENELAYTKSALKKTLSNEQPKSTEKINVSAATPSFVSPPLHSNAVQGHRSEIPAFYDECCRANSWYKWPLVATRRLFRRVQRPFFYSLHRNIVRMQRDLEQQRDQNETARRQIAELSSRMK